MTAALGDRPADRVRLLDRPQPDREGTDPLLRLARLVLTLAVRGRKARGGAWGEAVLAELEQTRGWAAMRWAAGGVRAALRERRARRRELPKLVRISRRVALTLVVGLLAAFLGERYVLTPLHVEPSGAMEPTLQVGDRFAVERVSTRFGVDAGDVVLFRWPHRDDPWGPDNFSMLKRVIGLVGDTIACVDGRVVRNGTVLDEPYLPKDPVAARTDCSAATVPDGHLYVLGDHRETSADSRHHGFLPTDAVEGRLLVVLG